MSFHNGSTPNWVCQRFLRNFESILATWIPFLPFLCNCYNLTNYCYRSLKMFEIRLKRWNYFSLDRLRRNIQSVVWLEFGVFGTKMKDEDRELLKIIVFFYHDDIGGEWKRVLKDKLPRFCDPIFINRKLLSLKRFKLFLILI